MQSRQALWQIIIVGHTLKTWFVLLHFRGIVWLKDPSELVMRTNLFYYFYMFGDILMNFSEKVCFTSYSLVELHGQ